MTKTDLTSEVPTTSFISPKELAVELDTDAKSVRRMLRKLAKDTESATPGRGGRWAISSDNLEAIKAHFAKGQAARTVTAPTPPVNEV